MRRSILVGLALWVPLATTGSARANLRAPRTNPEVPSSAAGPPAGSATDLQTRVLHEELTFRCRDRMCRVSASYLVEADRSAEVALDFILPANARVTGKLGTTPVPVSTTSAAEAGADLDRRLRLRQFYLAANGWPMSHTFRATASVGLQRGQNRIAFEYDQPLGALESDHGYFHNGRMVHFCYYVLWPLKEWSRAKDFAIDLRIEVDRKPPSWWKRTFGHPATVSCRDVRGQRAQVGEQLVYRASIGDPFPDYLDCQIGDDDLVHESAK